MHHNSDATFSSKSSLLLLALLSQSISSSPPSFPFDAGNKVLNFSFPPSLPYTSIPNLLNGQKFSSFFARRRQSKGKRSIVSHPAKKGEEKGVSDPIDLEWERQSEEFLPLLFPFRRSLPSPPSPATNDFSLLPWGQQQQKKV